MLFRSVSQSRYTLPHTYLQIYSRKNKSLGYVEFQPKPKTFQDDFNKFKHNINICSHFVSDCTRTKIPDDIKKCVFENNIS